jgi:hypothetical protein
MYRFVFQDYIFLLASITACGHSWRRLDLKLAEVKQGEGGGIGGTTFVQYSMQRSSLKAQHESQDAHATLLEQLNTYLTLSLPDAGTNAVLLTAESEAVLARRRAQEMVNLKSTCIHCSWYLYTHTLLNSYHSCQSWRAPSAKNSFPKMDPSSTA